MRIKKLAVASIVVLGITAQLAAPAGAAGIHTYLELFTAMTKSYDAVQNVAKAHDSYVKIHRPNCAGESSKWWTTKYPQDVTTIKHEVVSLRAISGPAQKKQRTYSDFVTGFQDLTHWMHTSIKPKLLNCKTMPTSSFVFESQRDAIAADLGKSTY